jgi:hypothetical protein
MMRALVTVDDLEAFAEQLRGPLGTALRAAGVILDRKMRERGLTWDDLNDGQIADLFMAAFMEAAPNAYPHLDRSLVEDAVSFIAKDIAMQLAATADGSDAIN